MRSGASLVLSALVAAAGPSCALPPLPADPPEPDRAEFDSVVYPILLADCGFPACHGSRDRFFRVHGPGRSRLDEATALAAPPLDTERTAAWERARSMLSSAESPEQSLLLRKPLELDAGGAPHAGVDANGRDVYASRDDPRWRAILAWAGGAPPDLPEVAP